MSQVKAWEEWLQTGKDLLNPVQAFRSNYAARIKHKVEVETAEKIPFNDILQRMNQILCKEFKLSESTKSHIRARWSEGFREKDFEKAVRVKHSQWANDPDMAPYLRPQTLFSTKMDGYCNEKLVETTIEEWR